MNYWILKSEGDCYSIDDLEKDNITAWTGIRNFQARNFMRDQMHKGDLVLYYHSNGTKEHPTGVYGTAKVIRESYPDPTQFDKKDQHYDPKSKKEDPQWVCVDIQFVSKFKVPVTLSEIKIDPKLEGILVAQKGSRLSVLPVSQKHFEYIKKLGK